MKAMRWTSIFLLLMGSILLPHAALGQLKTYRFEQIDSLQQREARPLVVFIHTDWCKYCLAMQKSSLAHRQVIALLNQHFYFVELNAEERRSIHFRGHQFRYKPTGYQTGLHELAEQLGSIDGKITYPTLTFLSAQNEIIYQRSGYLDADLLLKILSRLRQ